MASTDSAIPAGAPSQAGGAQAGGAQAGGAQGGDGLPPVPPPLPARKPRRFRIISALMLREMSTNYGRSPGGYIWTILEPVGGITLLVLIFSSGLRIRTPSLGINFPMFYATGLLILLMYQRCAGSLASALMFSRPLLRYPGVTFVDALTARLAVVFLTQALVAYLILGGIMLIFETRVILDLPVILAAFFLTALVGTGVGTLNAYLFPTFPMWASFWGILTFPLFFMSGIFFIYEDLPAFGQQILWWNPLIHMTGMIRDGFYPTYSPQYISVPYVLAWGLIPLALGLMLLRKHYKRIMNL